MKLAVSYFYQIRFFKPYMIPVSTAIWDPKWYHANRLQDYVFIDKRGVLNGVRIRDLMPGSSCANLCRGRENCSVSNPKECAFLRNYRKQLDAINFEIFMSRLESYANSLQEKLDFDEDPLLVFMVHEKYDNPCSEREVILNWFRDNGMYVSELNYPIDNFY